MKLYLATRTTTTMFVERHEESVEPVAKRLLNIRAGAENFPDHTTLDIKEIKFLSEIPEDWKHEDINGVSNPETATNFLKRKIEQDENEYKEYLRLKDKFETKKTIDGICPKCKNSGYIHRSIYTVGPGYYDEPDPDVYCDCPASKKPR